MRSSLYSGLPQLEPPARPRLFVEVQHGLCNRMRAMASAASIAARTGRELVVVWRTDDHCNAPMGALFDYDGLVLEDDDADLCRRSTNLRISYMEIEAGSQFDAPVLEDEAPGDPVNGDVWISSAYTLLGKHRVFEDEQAFLRCLVPSQEVLALVQSLRGPTDVAAHVRMATGPDYDHLPYESPANWPKERHQELLHWRAKSHADVFIARIDQLVEEGRADTIFLAADLPETYARFAARYSSRLSVLERQLFDRSARQLQYALADLIALTQADLLLASTWSSFSDMAQRLAHEGRPVEQSGYDF